MLLGQKLTTLNPPVYHCRQNLMGLLLSSTPANSDLIPAVSAFQCTLYRELTHSDRCFSLHSEHRFHYKHCVISTLPNRTAALTACDEEQAL